MGPGAGAAAVASRFSTKAVPRRGSSPGVAWWCGGVALSGWVAFECTCIRVVAGQKTTFKVNYPA